MVNNFNRNQNSIKRMTVKIAALLCLGLFGMTATQAYSHPHKSNKDSKKEGIKEVQNKQDDIRKKVEDRRIELEERRAALRKDAAERRKLREQESAKRRAEADVKKAEHLAFKNQLLSMLVTDGVISTDKEDVSIKYFDSDLIANGVNLSEQFGDKYKTLWTQYNRVVSDQSYLNIKLGSYELREITEDGKSHHFVMQTN